MCQKQPWNHCNIRRFRYLLNSCIMFGTQIYLQPGKIEQCDVIVPILELELLLFAVVFVGFARLRKELRRKTTDLQVFISRF